MFSLDALALRAQPSPAGRPLEEDDSGLIDLRALASGSSTRAEAALTVGPGDGSLFPLGPPPPDSVVAPAARPAAHRERPRRGLAERWMVPVLATVALLLGATVVFLLVRQGQPAPDASRPPAAVDSVVAERGPSAGGDEPSPSPSVPADPPSEVEPFATVGPDVVPTAPPVVASRVPPPATGPRPTPTGPAAATTTSPPEASRCPCPPDDLMCHMRCSVRH